MFYFSRIVGLYRSCSSFDYFDYCSANVLKVPFICSFTFTFWWSYTRESTIVEYLEQIHKYLNLKFFDFIQFVRHSHLLMYSYLSYHTDRVKHKSLCWKSYSLHSNLVTNFLLSWQIQQIGENYASEKLNIPKTETFHIINIFDDKYTY